LVPLHTTPDQWRTLAAVVDAGGFAQAAARLHRSQSAVSYSMARLQQSLGVSLLQVRGRKAELTDAGRELLRRSRAAVDQFERLEKLARSLHRGWEPELRLVIDASFPQDLLLSVLGKLRQGCPDTTIQLADAVLSGAEEAITQGEADVVVTTRVPPDVLGDWLMDVPMIAVSSPDHPLQHTGAQVAADDLVQHTQVVVRDSGGDRPRDEGWLGARHRWTVSSIEASLAAVRAGFAYAWLPQHRVDPLLASGELRTLPLVSGAARQLALYVVMVNGIAAGPAARNAVELLLQARPRS
jgi:DNA-binding transcriptional LysR family regulator